jgi:hypothetical protein
LRLTKTTLLKLFPPEKIMGVIIRTLLVVRGRIKAGTISNPTRYLINGNGY